MNLSKINKYFIPSTILDIGANIGQFHLKAKTHFANSFIFSVEASSECEKELKKITSNYFIGLLSKDTLEYNFYNRVNDPTSTGNSIYRELTKFFSDDQLIVIKKKGIRLDDLFNENTVFDLIKIDTQGSELDIISGGKKLCSKAKGIVLEVSLTPYNQNAPLYDQVVQFMDEFGFVKTEVLGEERNHGSLQQDILFLNKNLI